MGAAAGWYADGTGTHEFRYWNGSDWTDEVSDGGVRSIDPLAASLTPVAVPVPVKPKVPLYKNKALYALAIVAALLGAGIVLASSNDTPHSPRSDVTVTSCSPDSANEFQATLTVTNHSAARSNYVIEIAFDSNDGKTQLQRATVRVDGLGAGESIARASTSVAAANGAYTCRVMGVNRFASS